MTDVTYSGEYFNDAEYDTAMHLFVEESQKDIADAGVETVHGLLQSSIQHPTGYYESHIQSVRYGGAQQVDDDNVIYGSWLEGVSNRNDETRFKGYFSFRRATQTLQAQAEVLVQPALERLVGRLNS